MDIIVITHPELLPFEAEHLNALFSKGLKRLHLRKPLATKEEIRYLIAQIPAQYHACIRVHQHYDLGNEFALRGIHHKSTHDINDAGINKGYSRSCHSFEELKRYHSNYEYLFLSPIFDSISKDKYHSNFTLEQCHEFFLAHPEINNIVALGGISAKNISALTTIGFSGAAVIGSIWKNKCQSIQDTVNYYEQLVQQSQTPLERASTNSPVIQTSNNRVIKKSSR
ncbi:thiamine phosphate synthase [Puteibacter caeruleilacunae]|nr:thiamine phosphate synthase [Puteibacter caeruleilacunae]